MTQEPPLASNLVMSSGATQSGRRKVRGAEELPLVLQRAFKEAMAPAGSLVSVGIPWELTLRRIGADHHIPGVTGSRCTSPVIARQSNMQPRCWCRPQSA